MNSTKSVSSFFTPTPDWSQIQPQVSRWGKRSYSVQGFAGRVNLNQIVKIYKKQGAPFDKAAVAREIRALDQKGQQRIVEVTKKYRICPVFHAMRSAFGRLFFSREKLLQQWEKSVLSSSPSPPGTPSPTIAALREKITSFEPKGKYPQKAWTLKNRFLSSVLGIQSIASINENSGKCLRQLEQFLSEIKEMRKEVESVAGEGVKQALDAWIKDSKEIKQILQKSVSENSICEKENSWKKSQGSFSIELYKDDMNQGVAQFIEAASRFTVEAGDTPENRQFAMQSIIQKLRDYLCHRGQTFATGAGNAEEVYEHLTRTYFCPTGNFICEENEDEDKPFLFPWNKNLISNGESERIVISQIIHPTSHYFNMCYIDGKQMYCDNGRRSSLWSSHGDGEIGKEMSLQKEQLEKLGNVIDQQKLVIPFWENSNCYLSAAWIHFSICLEYNRRLNALEEQS